MKTYETIVILDDRRVKDEGKAFSEKFSSLVKELGGEVIKQTYLGRKQFAYEIRKRKTGLYRDFVLNLSEEAINTLPEKYRLNDEVLRFQSFIYDRPEESKKVTEKSEPAEVQEPKKEVAAEDSSQA